MTQITEKIKQKPPAQVSQIIESKKITDILNYVNQETLVVFDIDNTLIDTVQDFGSYFWCCDTSSKFQEKGVEYVCAMKKTNVIFEQIQEFISFKPVEPETVTILNSLQTQNIKTMALTKRPFPIKKVTEEQLLQADVTFSKNPIHDSQIIYSELIGFSQGIFYTGLGDNKGDCLLSFLEKINYTPEHVIFIDDTPHHVEHVHNALCTKNILNTCIRYGYADGRGANFNHAKANQELLEVIGQEKYNTLFKELL